MKQIKIIIRKDLIVDGFLLREEFQKGIALCQDRIIKVSFNKDHDKWQFMHGEDDSILDLCNIQLN